MVTVPVRLRRLVFSSTRIVTVPLPAPLYGLTDKKTSLLHATQGQSSAVVTVTEIDSPAAGVFLLLCDRVYVQLYAACTVTVKRCVAIEPSGSVARTTISALPCPLGVIVT